MSVPLDSSSNSSKDNTHSDNLRKKRYDCPWMTTSEDIESEDLREKSYHKELLNFADWVSPTEEERAMRRDVVERLESVITSLYSEARVEVYGSFNCDLCVPQSDIDLVVLNTQIEEDQRASALAKLALDIHKHGLTKFVPTVISTTKVPIIKLIDHSTKCMVDISFECRSGILNTNLIKKYLDEYPHLKPLALILKYYLKLCYLNDTWTGGIGSYTLLVLIIFYLQKHTPSKGLSSEDENLALILTGFLNFYGNQYDYTNSVISILDGGSYLTKAEKKWFDEAYPDRLSVEDPQNVDNDLGRASFNIEKARLAFQKGYQLLSESINSGNISKSFVLRLIHVPQEEIKHRHTLKMGYRGWSKRNLISFEKKSQEDEDNTHCSRPTVNNVQYVNSNNALSDKKQKQNNHEDIVKRKRKKNVNTNGESNRTVKSSRSKPKIHHVWSKRKVTQPSYTLDEDDFPSLESVYLRDQEGSQKSNIPTNISNC